MLYFDNIVFWREPVAATAELRIENRDNITILKKYDYIDNKNLYHSHLQIYYVHDQTTVLY